MFGGSHNVRVYRVAEPNVPLSEIAGARFGKSLGNPRLGLAWRVPGNVKDTRIGVFLSSEPIVLGEQAGHEYEFIDVIPSATPRLAWVDCEYNGGTMQVQNCGVSTSLLDGTDVRSLHTGCSSMQGSLSKVAAHGIAFNCVMGTAEEWWFSDGVAPAFELAQSVFPLPAGRDLAALMPNRAIFIYPAEAHLTSQPLVAASIEVNLYETDSATVAHTLLGSGGGRLIVVRNSGVAAALDRFTLRTMDEDGGNLDLKLQSAGNFSLRDVSPDGTRFVTTVTAKDGGGTNTELWSYAFAANANPDVCGITPSISATDSTFNAEFASDGDIVVVHVNDGWRVVDDCTAGGGAAMPHPEPIKSASYSWAGLKGSFFFLNAASGDFVAANTADQIFDLSLADPPFPASAPFPVHRAEGVVLFADDALNAWIAIFNPTTNLFEKTLIGVDTVRIEDAGEGSDNRLYLTMFRSAGHGDIVAVDLNTLTATTLIGGPSNDHGFFFPN